MNKIQICVLLATLLNTASAFADLEGKKPRPQGWFWGFGAGYTESIYEGKGNEFIPIPAIGYIGESLEFYGPFGSYKFVNDGPFSARARLAVRFDGYEAEDSASLSGMDDRDRTIDGGLVFGYQPKDVARFELSYMHDVLSKHKGSETSFQISRQFNRGPFFFVPEVSVHYLSANLIDYYYGVKESEATANRAAYSAKSGLSYRADLNFSTPILFGGFTRIDLGYIWYANEISDSPIVDETEGYNIRFAWTRFF